MQTHQNSLSLIHWCGVLLAALALALTPLRAQAQETINIQCSPSVVYLDSIASGDWMTVHTDLPFAEVDRATVELNGMPASVLKADSRGNLVAKFDLTELKETLATPSATLTLTGVTVDGVEFVGSDEVRVVAPRSPAGGKQSRNNAPATPSPKVQRGKS